MYIISRIEYILLKKNKNNSDRIFFTQIESFFLIENTYEFIYYLFFTRFLVIH